MQIGRLFKQTLAPVALALAMTGAPAAAAGAQPPPLATYGHLPDFEMASISPSGGHIAVLANVGGLRRLVVLDAKRQPTFQTVIDPTNKVRGLTWAGDQAVLIDYTQTVKLGANFTTDKAELGSVLVLPLDTGKPWAVFAGDEDIVGGVWSTYGVVQKNGRWFGFFGGVTLKSGGLGFDKYLPDGAMHPDLYEVDLQNRHHRKIANHIEGDHSRRSWLIDDKGAIGAVLDLDRDHGDWKLFGGNGQKLALGNDKLGSVQLIGFAPDGAGVVYGLRDADGERDTWFSVPLAGGAPQPYLDDIEIDRVFQDKGHRLIGYIERSATGAGHFFDARHDKIYQASRRAFPDEIVALTDANDAFDRLLVKTEGPGDPETWWLVDITTHHADPLGYSYDVQPGDVGPMKPVHYTAADGLKMEGVLTLPPDRPARSLPAIILPHGGPAAYDTIRFDWIAQAFASRGYAVFQPNFRGSTGYGVAFETAGSGEWGRKMQTDLSDGLAELVRQGVVNPARVCIVGASYGGYAALAGVTLQHGVYRCAVAIAGIGDLTRMVTGDIADSGDDPTLTRNLRREIGTGRDLKAVSPIRFVDKVDAPVLLIHGKDDTVVKFEQSSDMADALRRAGKPVEFVTLKAEDHWLSKSDTRLQMLEASVNFVLRHNPPDAAPPAVPPATKVP